MHTFISQKFRKVLKNWRLILQPDIASSLPVGDISPNCWYARRIIMTIELSINITYHIVGDLMSLIGLGKVGAGVGATPSTMTVQKETSGWD